MRTTKAHADILRMRRPVVTTGEVAAWLGLPRYSASRLLLRLSRDGLVVKLRRGLWGIGQRFDPLTIVPALTAPYPSYVSLWSALHYHGMIDQIPRDVYVVSVDRSKRIRTPVATYVVQHLDPALFGGYEPRNGARLATPEKALFDTVYLTRIRGRRRSSLPEIELPQGFDDAKVQHWVERIGSKRLRTLVGERIRDVLARAERE
jgi:predicted transcriptional regulator of viral defense system